MDGIDFEVGGLASVKVDAKSDEITAIPKLFALTANWALAMVHSRGGIRFSQIPRISCAASFHSFSDLFKIR